jgi:hypothetical protein
VSEILTHFLASVQYTEVVVSTLLCDRQRREKALVIMCPLVLKHLVYKGHMSMTFQHLTGTARFSMAHHYNGHFLGEIAESGSRALG